ncbi:DNA/RNA nuclease SfsA [Alteromonas sediminis]|uniref:Sugar fermentation stimulation protein homolog n=1 Tax=Alteromonas sediminis TaxID=2259342 RepID=A0A3N5Z4B8_9ALTE|nr:DNA/RNA nuclease SfsA [Alteromonas sediminis]RPJ64834.1 DNA/RNA nuclease SfsA [Alteromonas sediminis]
MEFSCPLLKGKLIKRYKRFLADIELESGEVITAHCPNTGAMTHCATPGWTVYVRFDPNPKRKLAYTWELCVTDQGHWIGINTHNANKLVNEALAYQKALFPFHFDTIKSERHLNGSASRFDFVLHNESSDEYHVVEVKSVTLLEKDQGYFPDAKTTRGTRHCIEMTELVKQGIKCSLVFCVQHTGIKRVSPAAHIDPEYANALVHAYESGVSIHALGCAISKEKMTINQSLPVIV